MRCVGESPASSTAAPLVALRTATAATSRESFQACDARGLFESPGATQRATRERMEARGVPEHGAKKQLSRSPKETPMQPA